MRVVITAEHTSAPNYTGDMADVPSYAPCTRIRGLNLLKHLHMTKYIYDIYKDNTA